MSVFFSWNERLHSTINTWTMQYFTYSWHCTITTHIANLILFEFLLFMKPQFTRYAQIVFVSISVSWNASEHGLSNYFKFPGAVAKWLDRHHKYASEVAVPFQLKLNILLGFLSVPQIKMCLLQCEHCNKPSVSDTYVEFLASFNDYQFLEKNSFSRN
jgi:hypothetical protein